ncbi:hypothetical protein BCF55_1867 [Hydrogenivirga caldilitoris]|uniref:Uncharacterized protein n=1 Tax=Hydrogenivirga caldilitoris TaxID=246264 RepID=A0A497XXR7_9AQUI|nr:hypothetical protein [Hydrogenivirga caldilitoris]RLJ71563.1 hypothetical protein BCF55_1867 [Hydrogenivirga caldilitoris]
MSRFLLVLFTVAVVFGQDRKLVYGGVFTGAPEDYLQNIKVISGELLERTCICSVKLESSIRSCVGMCVSKFEKDVKERMKSVCKKNPNPAELMVYGAGDLKVSYFRDEAVLKEGDIQARYDVSVVTVYGTGFCAVLKTSSE